MSAVRAGETVLTNEQREGFAILLPIRDVEQMGRPEDRA